MSKKQPIPFGKYLLLDRVNIGGMAEVWRAKTFGAEGFEKLIALKRILPNIAEDEEFITMFIDEAKISVQLTHANVAQVFDLGKVGESYFLAMEYISGKDLRAVFDRARKRGEPAPIPLSCFCVAKASEGLDYAHRKKEPNGDDLNIVHRDVSPQNILLSYDGEVKVIDFGIAKAANKATKTQAGILKGKFGYMSPEQVRGLPLDRRSDVFALGVVLYEMLTGERLFIGDSDFSVLEKVRAVDILPPSTYNRRIPPALEKIVLKALAKDVEDRFQYASELSDELQRFLITSDSIFSRKDLMQFMKSTFAEDVEREKVKLAEYHEVKLPPGMAALAGLTTRPAPGSVPPRTPSLAPKAPPVPPSLGTAPSQQEQPEPEGTNDRTEIGALPPSAPPPRPAPGAVPPRTPSAVGGPPRAPVVGPPVGRPGPPMLAAGTPVGAKMTTAGMPALAPGAPMLSPPARPGGAPRTATPAPFQPPRPAAPFTPPVGVQGIGSDSLDEPTAAPTRNRPPSQPQAAVSNMDFADGDGDMGDAPTPQGAAPASRKKVMTMVGVAAGVLGLGVVGAMALGGGGGSGSIAVDLATAPPGVSVLVDGKAAPPGSLTVSGLAAGPHQLLVMAPGYERVERTVEVKKDASEVVDVKLKKKGGDDEPAPAPKKAAPKPLTGLVSEALGAEIKVDGEVVREKGNKDPWAGALDPAVEHKVDIELDGYKAVHETYPAGAAVKFTAPLEKAN